MVQNEFRRLNQAFTDCLMCLGDSGGSPIDISCTLTRSDIFGIPYLPVINRVRNFLQKFLTSVSKILTSGFALDLGAQEEFDDNFSCFVKRRCSTLYFSKKTKKLAGLDFGVLSDRNLASRAQIAPKRAQKAKPSFYRWF